MTPTMRDPNSVSNILAFVTKHIRLDWTVNFTKSRLEGSAILTLARLAKEKTVKLDCSHLDVRNVKDVASGQPLQWRVDKKACKFGGLLAIDLPNEEESNYDIQY